MIKIFAQSNSIDFAKAVIKCSTRYGLGRSHRTTFANGELTVVLEESVRNETIIIVAQPTDYAQMFELLATIDAAKRSSAKEIIALVPYLPHSRQERRDSGERTAISARLFADMLQVAGLDRLVTMDIHTTAIEGFYKIPFDNIEAFPVILNKIKSLNLENPTIVSPDFGGMKRVKKYNKVLNYNLAFLSKERLKANEVSEMTLLGSVKDSDVIIIDDMIDTGGTILSALDILKENGARNIHVFTTHGIFSKGAVEKFATNQHIPYLYSTNTLPQNYGTYAGFEIMNVACEFHNALRKII